LGGGAIMNLGMIAGIVTTLLFAALIVALIVRRKR
jgi:hypothetical protein